MLVFINKMLDPQDTMESNNKLLQTFQYVWFEIKELNQIKLFIWYCI
jgi:hypothetical protein